MLLFSFFWTSKYISCGNVKSLIEVFHFANFQNSPDCYQHTWGRPSGSSLYEHGRGSSRGSECSWRPNGDGGYHCRRRGGLATSCLGKLQCRAPCWQERMQSVQPDLLKRKYMNTNVKQFVLSYNNILPQTIIIVLIVKKCDTYPDNNFHSFLFTQLFTVSDYTFCLNLLSYFKRGFMFTKIKNHNLFTQNS